MNNEFYNDDRFTVLCGDALNVLKGMESESVNMCVTSPPYWGLRSYLPEDHPLKMQEIGSEKSHKEYIEKLVAVFTEVRRVLKKDGTLWVNIGDTYATTNAIGNRTAAGGSTLNCMREDYVPPINKNDVCVSGERRSLSGFKRKDLMGIPWRVALALQDDGWWLRNDIIWAKGISGDAAEFWVGSVMPEAAFDRCTRSHEYLFLLAKDEHYYFDSNAVAEPLRGKKGNQKSDKRLLRTVWTIGTGRFRGAHFAVFPPKLVELCIMAGCPKGGVVLDPFLGSGTTIEVASRLDRRSIGIEVSEQYAELTVKRLKGEKYEKRKNMDNTLATTCSE